MAGPSVASSPAPPASPAPDARVAGAPSSARWRSVAWDALIVTLAVVIYLPCLRGEMTWDDWDALRDNAALRSAGGLRDIWTSPHGLIEYYPLTYTTWWLEVRLFGLRPFVFHLDNVLLHGACGVALRRLLLRLRVPGATASALVFVAHPVFVESVAWMVERKNVLSGLFFLTSAIAYVRFMEAPADAPPRSQPRRRRRAWYALSLALFAMALLGKTATVVLPGALLMLGWWREGWAGWRRAVTPLLPFLVLAAAAAAVTIWVENFREKVIDPVQWSPAQRVVLAGQVVWFYLGKLLFPRGLIHVYPSWTPDAARAASYIPAAAAVAVLLALWATRRAWGRGPVVGWAYYLLALLPVMGFINIDYHRLTPVADHFQYLAGMGMVALVVGASSALLDRRAHGGAGGDAAYHATGAALVAMLVVILGALSVRRAALFGDVERLWAQTVRLNPDSAIARRALAEHRRLRQDFDGAVAELEEAVRRQPHDQEGHEQLGQLLLERGERGRALEHLARGPLARYTVWPHLSNYAVELLTRGDFVGAERCLRRALELSNDNPDVQANLAMLLATAGDPRVAKPEEAVRLARALCAAPGGHTPQNLITLAVATAAAGQLTDASNALDQAANIARLTGDEQLLVRVEQLRAQLGAWSGPR